jgi:hypothetical protein
VLSFKRSAHSHLENHISQPFQLSAREINLKPFQGLKFESFKEKPDYSFREINLKPFQGLKLPNVVLPPPAVCVKREINLKPFQGLKYNESIPTSTERLK